MNFSKARCLPGLILVALLCACDSDDSSTEECPESPTPVEFTTNFEAITVITFDADGRLYIADSGTGEIHALMPAAATNENMGNAFNLRNVDTTIAELLGTSTDRIRIRDLAVHPSTTEAYVAVARINGDMLESTVVVIDQSGQARILEAESQATVSLPFAPTDDFMFYDTFMSRDLSITDLTAHDGVLYATGMSNADFASTLWTVPLPFAGQPTVTTVEIYHGIHGQSETRAPIRTMVIEELNGEPTVIAAYTCTPLVAFPVSAIQDGEHITGKTIGELGYGNTPGDLLAIAGQDNEGNPTRFLYVNNKNQSGQVIAMGTIEAAINAPGIEAPLGITKVDLGASETPMTGILHLDDLDPTRLLGVRRDPDEGDIELVSYLKGVYFRLSDFQSEYEVPNYEYPPDQDGIRQFQNNMKLDEGYPDAVN